MRKILAALLVICTVLCLTACGGTVDSPVGNTTTPSAPAAATTPTTEPTTNTKPYAGKMLVIWGMNKMDYTDYTQFDKDDEMWMIRAAIDEWAAINEVEIKYAGKFNYMFYLATMNNPRYGDIVFETDAFSEPARTGLFERLTEEECAQLSAITGNARYVNILRQKSKHNLEGASYGVVLPWAGNMMVYFNQSLFAKYNVKSPLEYYNEGNWTWENFEKCMTEITRDLDNDGTTDIYGLSGNSWEHLVNPDRRYDPLGQVANTVDDPWVQDFIEMKYNAYNLTHCSKDGANDQDNFAMEISACRTYDATQVYKTTSDGDNLLAVPLPEWEGESGQSKQWIKLVQSCAHLSAGAAEREAAFDLLCYIIQCGMRYMSDYSLGAIPCDHPGIQGSTELSKNWKAAFSAAIAKNFIQSGHYDAAYIRKIWQHLPEVDEWYTYAQYANVPNPLIYPEIVQMPPESSIPTIREKYQATLDRYNSLYT